MPKGWNTDRAVVLDDNVRTLQMQYRVEYILNRHRKSKNNKPVKNKALIMPCGSLALNQFVDRCLTAGEDQKVEYVDLYLYFRKMCLDDTGHPDMDLPLFEQRLEERIYQVKHQMGFKLKQAKEGKLKLSAAAKAKASQLFNTDIHREGKYWLGIGISKPKKFDLHLPDGFLEFDAANDDAAYDFICTRKEFDLHDERPIAGKNYLRFSRQKFWLRK